MRVNKDIKKRIIDGLIAIAVGMILYALQELMDLIKGLDFGEAGKIGSAAVSAAIYKVRSIYSC